MSKPTKSAQKPTSIEDGLETGLQQGNLGALRQEFYFAVLNMSWQLAIVVLVPLLLGHWADDHFHTFPLWTIVGFLVAISNMALIVWRQLQKFSPKVTSFHKAKGQHS
jgi:F0F1-type ATP synthase assembly protein I